MFDIGLIDVGIETIISKELLLNALRLVSRLFSWIRIKKIVDWSVAASGGEEIQTTEIRNPQEHQVNRPNQLSSNI